MDHEETEELVECQAAPSCKGAVCMAAGACSRMAVYEVIHRSHEGMHPVTNVLQQLFARQGVCALVQKAHACFAALQQAWA